MATENKNEVLAYCGACKLNLTHQVIARVGNEVAKVLCKTCKATHKYRAPKGDAEVETEQKVKKARQRGETVGHEKKKVISVETLWKEAMAKAQGNPTPYSVRAKFEKGHLLDHKQFGTGIVQEILHPDKVKVLFQDNERILIHDRH